MENFKTIWGSINNQSGIIYVSHKLFGGTKYACEKIQTICDRHVIGVVIKGSAIYIPIKDIIEYECNNDELYIKSDRQQIKIFLKNFKKVGKVVDK